MDCKNTHEVVLAVDTVDGCDGKIHNLNINFSLMSDLWKVVSSLSTPSTPRNETTRLCDFMMNKICRGAK
jgi:hypothetical protein